MRFSDFIKNKYVQGAAMAGTAASVGLLGRPTTPAPHPTPVATVAATASPIPAAAAIAPVGPAASPRKVNPLSYIARYIAKNEDTRRQVYKDGRGKPTVGIGHLITPQSRITFDRLFGDSIDFDALLAGREQLTLPQVHILFEHDLQKHLGVARRVLPQFDNYPVYLQAALADAVYRGDLGTKTATLINAGRWGEAATEYLNRRDYRDRVALNVRGIGPRMEQNRDAMLRFAAELANN